MCGIAGKVWFGSTPDPDISGRLLTRMNNRMAHRGPDARGVWTDPSHRTALAHCRLAIIDLDARSNQPMRSQDGQTTVTFNGEIYNFIALRALFEKKQYEWQTNSDTEVLLAAYEGCHGDIDGFINQLRGMFAFAVWDGRRDRLLLARDPVGKKPLYYAVTPRGLTFASTVGALLEDPDIPREIDWRALRLYLTLGYVPAPYSAFKGISKLEAGHYLIAHPSGEINIRRYWKPEFEPKIVAKEPELIERILYSLEEATRIRLLSDVPLGVFLSGGIDSTAVVAMMRRTSPARIKTFSVGFAGFDGDESGYAQVVARHFGCDHHALTVSVLPDHLPQIVGHFEEPFADAAAIPTFFMAKAAREHVTVVLNGDGGDEDFAGYTLRHRTFDSVERFNLPSALRHSLMSLSTLLPAFRWSEGSFPYRLRKSLRVAGGRGWERNVALMELFPFDASLGLPGDQRVHDEPLLERHWEIASRCHGLDRELYFSFGLHLPEQLLVKVDRASMAWALEARSPLLDRDVVELCARIPTTSKLTPKEDKHIFRRAMHGLVPSEILSRRKQGFIPPLGAWLRNELRPLVSDALLGSDSFVNSNIRGIGVRRLIEDHLDGRRDHQRQLYALLNLELWERMFIRRQSF